MFFRSYKEAHERLQIPGSYQRGTIGNEETGITSLKLTSNPRSYDRISKDFKTIVYVGFGKKSSQGEPSINQTLEDQKPFFISKQTKKAFPVLIKIKPNVVFFPGVYSVKAIEKQTSKQGLDYFQIHLKQVNTPHTYLVELTNQ